jgi:hypothetical protein
MKNPDKYETNECLQRELERLKNLSGLGFELNIYYCPTENSRLSGEVKNKVVCIYEQDPLKALDVLVHEFIDYLISNAIGPYIKAAHYYRKMINALIEEFGEEAYSEKERVVEALKKIVSKSHT